jgi:extracellular factor (EF) 3-hydroxypalmitic acid methyl ester biosynthesis protein
MNLRRSQSQAGEGMDKLAGTDCLVSFTNSEGVEISGTVVRLTRDAVSFEVYSPTFPLRASELLADFKIMAGERPLYMGRAVVNQLVRTGSTGLCEAGLEDSWLQIDFADEASFAQVLPQQFDRFIREWQKDYAIATPYKLIVADMHTFLTELRNWLEQVEIGIRSAPSRNRLELEQQTLDSLAGPVLPYIDELFAKFEAVAATIESDQQSAHRRYMQRHLHPLVMSSPFAYRTYQKPLGYAGDYEMVNMMARPPYEGSTLYAKMLNIWFLKQMPAEAHRNRLQLLQSILLEESLRVSRVHGRVARIFNLACGPAAEVQAFLAQDTPIPLPQFTLVDFNDETLQHGREVFRQLGTRLGKSFAVEFQKRSVHSILKEFGRIVELSPDKQFDLVYCAGLFDYLPDSVCQRLLEILYSWVAPGGLLLATNVDPSNPIKYGMEHLLDWHLIYRGSQASRSLKPSTAPEQNLSVLSDTTGVNIFIRIRRPENG